MKVYRGGADAEKFPETDRVDLRDAKANRGEFLISANISGPNASERRSEVLLGFERSDVPALLELVRRLVAQDV